jgi:2,3-bisphosphoglycerate-independent phosphoglycerate mutase
MKVLHKGLMIVLDGLGDRCCPALGGVTPLEAADTPMLDRLAGRGVCGLVDPLYPGVPVGTHTGTGVLMGLSVRDAARLARGPVEGAGVGLDLKPGEVILRCNFATLAEQGDGFAILDRRAGRIKSNTETLAASLRDLELGHGITGSLYAATQHRAVLHLHGDGLSAEITDTDPGSGRGERGVLWSDPIDPTNAAAVITAEATNAFVEQAYRTLTPHPVNRTRQAEGLPPANGILTRGAGSVSRHRNLIDLTGLRAAVVTGERTVVGLARLLGFESIIRDDFTALPDTNLAGKVEAAMAALEDHDFVMLHIKGPDICSHDKDPEGKRDMMERIDESLDSLDNQDIVIGVTGDHSTDSNIGRHCGNPVPTLLCSPTGRRDGVFTFGEATCSGGGLGRLSGTGFLASVLDAMGAMSNYTPAQRPLFF